MSQDPITPPPDARGAPTVLRLSGITKRFGPLLANDGISLQLARGEVLALLGENGAGKSTLMSILFGHYVADAGHIEAFGAPLPALRLAAACRQRRMPRLPARCACVAPLPRCGGL